MSFVRVVAPILAAGVVFFTGGIQQAEARTVITTFVEGTFDFTTTRRPTPASGVFITGTFGAEAFGPLPKPFDTYELSGTLTLAGSPIFDEGITFGASRAELLTAFSDLVPVVGFLNRNVGNTLELDGLGFDFDATLTSFSRTGLAIAGAFDISIDRTEFPPIGDALSLLASSIVGAPLPFNIPNNTQQPIAFRFDAALETAPIPLPASLPLLAAAGGALALVRRARRDAAA